MKTIRPQVIAGVALAIPNLWHLFDQSKSKTDGLFTCRLCGADIASGSGQISHGRAHVRRHELEEVIVDGVVIEDGEKRTGWQGETVGYRTPGAPGFYAIEIVTPDQAPYVKYERGEMPRSQTFASTAKEALSLARPFARSNRSIEARELIDPPSCRNTPAIEERVRAAFLNVHPWAAKIDVLVGLMFIGGNWTVTTSREKPHEYPCKAELEERVFDVEDSDAAHAIDVFDGFRFVELGP
jgi:hypothetical protein